MDFINQQEFISKLEEIRKSPRKMHSSYLQQHNLLDDINELVPNNFKIKEKIDIILKGVYDKCYCGEFSKADSKWCSITCRNKDSEIRKIVGEKNSENKVSRSKKMKETLMEKYGVSAVQDIPYVKEKTKEKNTHNYQRWVSETFLKYGLDEQKFSDFDYLNQICEKSSFSRLSKEHFNGMPLMTIYRHFERIGFECNFNKNGSSVGEIEVGEYIKGLGFEIIERDRKVIKPLELDILVPEKNFAVEFNGLYYHNSDKNRHIIKTQLCTEKGIKLIQIFEDEWYLKQNIVKSIINSKLGILPNKIFARNTVLKSVETKCAKNFINENHIQGFVGAEIYYGLYYNDELVSVLSVGKDRFVKARKELIRYCNKLDCQIIGGFSKLLKRAKQDYDEIYSYSNLRYFDGEIYNKYGKFIKQTEPSYYWTNPSKGVRITRYQTKKHKLSKLLKNNFNPSLTEEENMINSGFLKIWDCGNKLYLL